MNDVMRDEILSLSGAKPAWSQRDVVVAPVLGLYGGADGGISHESVDKMRAALKAAGKTRSESVTYPDTPHAFHADYRPTYRKEQADNGWKRLQEWFKKHL